MFLLFYAIPVLKNYLPSEYPLHLSLLVFSIHTLLSNTINLEVLSQVQLFYTLIPKLYDNSLCTANVHSLSYGDLYGLTQHSALKMQMAKQTDSWYSEYTAANSVHD